MRAVARGTITHAQVAPHCDARRDATRSSRSAAAGSLPPSIARVRIGGTSGGRRRVAGGARGPGAGLLAGPPPTLDQILREARCATGTGRAGVQVQPMDAATKRVRATEMSAAQRDGLGQAGVAPGGPGSLQQPLLREVRPPADNTYLYALTSLAAIGGFLFGYDTGVVSGAMLLLVKEFGFSSKQQELIVSVTLVGCIFSACLSSIATTKLGRQPVILFASMVFIAGSAILSTAENFEMLLVGRAVVGIAVGLASMAVPMYIAEAAPPEKRGMLVTVNNVFVTGGQFIACIIDALFSKVNYPHGWRCAARQAPHPNPNPHILTRFPYKTKLTSPRGAGTCLDSQPLQHS